MQAETNTHIRDGDLGVLHRTPGRCAFGHCGNVALQAWFEPPDAAIARILHTSSLKLIQQYPMGLSSIHWLRTGGQLPDQETRVLLRQTLSETGHHFGQLVFVMTGNGFWASAARGMLTSLGFAARNRDAFRVVPTIEDAVAWLAEPHRLRTGVSIDRVHLAATMSQLVDTV